MNSELIALNRFGLGARIGDPEIRQPQRWLLQQLERFESDPQALRNTPTHAEVSENLRTWSQHRFLPRDERLALGPSRELRMRVRQETRRHYQEMAVARVASAVHTSTPFVERMVHFWANHFAVSLPAMMVTPFAGLMEFDAIRPNVLGSFSTMLRSVEQHPAMLFYLNQERSIGPNSQFGSRLQARDNAQAGLNENLGREILELHTLGVNGGYSQSDVLELSRALTGWTVNGLANGPAGRLMREERQAGGFRFLDRIHEPGTRTLLGRSYDQSGVAQAEAILDDLAVHPSTARHIATKLARHFLGDHASDALVDSIADTFLQTDGDLPTVYRALIDHRDLWHTEAMRFRTPWEWTIAALRSLNFEQGIARAPAMVSQLGQPIWIPASPAGFPDGDEHWRNAAALMRRLEIARGIGSRARRIVDPRDLLENVARGSLSSRSANVVASAASPWQGITLALMTPEFLGR